MANDAAGRKMPKRAHQASPFLKVTRARTCGYVHVRLHACVCLRAHGMHQHHKRARQAPGEPWRTQAKRLPGCSADHAARAGRVHVIVGSCRSRVGHDRMAVASKWAHHLQGCQQLRTHHDQATRIQTLHMCKRCQVNTPALKHSPGQRPAAPCAALARGTHACTRNHLFTKAPRGRYTVHTVLGSRTYVTCPAGLRNQPCAPGSSAVHRWFKRKCKSRACMCPSHAAPCAHACCGLSVFAGACMHVQTSLSTSPASIKSHRTGQL